MAPRTSYPMLPTVLTGLVLVIAAVLGIFLPTQNGTIKSGNGSDQRCAAQSAQANADSADLILTGTVFAVVPGEPYARVLITPVRVYRGTILIGGITVLASADADRGDTVAPTDLHFASSDPPYLLFLKGRSDETYTTSRCDGSRILGVGLTAEERSVLGEGRVP